MTEKNGSTSEREEPADSADDREDLAEQRTDWAKERTLLAKQRTFGAWLRNGLAALAVGFGVAELLGDLEPRWLVQLAAALLIVAGGAMHVLGFVEYRKTFLKLREEGVQGVSPWIIGGVTGGLLLCAAILLVVVLGE